MVRSLAVDLQMSRAEQAARPAIHLPDDAEVYYLGNERVAVCPEEFIALRDGELCPLTPQELKLLATLAMRPGHLYTKAALYEEVWEQESVGDTSLVRVTVSHVREKLGKDDLGHPQRGVIKTRVSLGYEGVVDLNLLRQNAS